MDFLVVDDDKTFRDAACMMAEAAGHYTEAAGSGADALALLKREKFEAVLLDRPFGRGKQDQPEPSR